EICAFNIQGLEAPFEAVVLNGTSGEGQLRARGLVDCELQKEYTFIIQAHDCGSGPGGAEVKKSHNFSLKLLFAQSFRKPALSTKHHPSLFHHSTSQPYNKWSQ
ncbi:hypothetical protein KUCAC02_029743, partial [Chaenocephalus aceratus]